MVCLMVCCLTIVEGYAQNNVGQPLIFEEFFHDKMEKISGVLPVYRDSTGVYLEISEELIGREIEIRAQINQGFDMVARPLESLGVVYLHQIKDHAIYWQRRIFSERVSDKNNELYEVLLKSNMQAMDIVYPVKAYSADRKGCIIDITGMLKNGEEWFQVTSSKMRGQKESLAKISEVHSFREGVSFTINRMYGFVPERLVDNVIPPSGFLPVEIGCVITLLPEREMRERFADKRFGFHVIPFWDYSQNPYRAERDSIIQKWNLGIAKKDRGIYQRGKLVEPLRPIVFYIDTCCPREFVSYIKEGVLAWNIAFEKAGFKKVLRVKMADLKTALVEQQAVIAYDLGERGVKASYTCHPKTGEILSCRINIGHGFLEDELWRYLLQCGMVDARIRKNRLHPVVAGEILRGQVMKAVGAVLGLKENLAGSTAFTIKQVKDVACLKKYGYTGSVMDENPYNYAVQEADRVSERELMPRVGEYDCLTIEWGYREFPMNKNSSEDREILRGKYDQSKYLFGEGNKDVGIARGDLSSDPLKALDCGMKNLFSLKEVLENVVSSGELNESFGALMNANQKVIDLYGEYLLQAVSYVGGKRGNKPVPANEQHDVMVLLNKYLFSGGEGLVFNTLKGNVWWEINMKEACIRQMKRVFQKLLTPDVIGNILEMEDEYLENVYTIDMYFEDLFSMLFYGFDASSKVSFARMDMQILCVKTLLEQISDASESVATTIVKSQLRELCKLLKILSEKHEDKDVQRIYYMLVMQIEKGIDR